VIADLASGQYAPLDLAIATVIVDTNETYAPSLDEIVRIVSTIT
jgi:hypothetical protein